METLQGTAGFICWQYWFFYCILSLKLHLRLYYNSDWKDHVLLHVLQLLIKTFPYMYGNIDEFVSIIRLPAFTLDPAGTCEQPLRIEHLSLGRGMQKGP